MKNICFQFDLEGTSSVELLKNVIVSYWNVAGKSFIASPRLSYDVGRKKRSPSLKIDS